MAPIDEMPWPATAESGQWQARHAPNQDDPHGHLLLLDDPLIAIIPQRESIGHQGKCYFFRFTRGQQDSLKPLQGTNRLSNTCSVEPDIKLNNFFART